MFIKVTHLSNSTMKIRNDQKKMKAIVLKQSKTHWDPDPDQHYISVVITDLKTSIYACVCVCVCVNVQFRTFYCNSSISSSCFCHPAINSEYINYKIIIAEQFITPFCEVSYILISLHCSLEVWFWSVVVFSIEVFS